MDAITTEEMMRIEERAHAMGVTRLLMMENAGAGVAHHIASSYHNIERKDIVIVAGLGNNGGDAMVAARHLTYYKADVTVILLGKGIIDIRTEEARTNWRILERMSNSLKLVQLNGLGLDDVKSIIASADIIVDGIFGTGIKGSIREPHSSIIDAINNSKAYKVAVDVPSGLDPDTGRYDKCVIADATVTFHRAKRGLSANSICGKIIVWPIGIPPEAEVL
ncbi:MAG: NAD(P)H-hydrate epimerase [Candidatus Nitrosocaldus sp.]